MMVRRNHSGMYFAHWISHGYNRIFVYYGGLDMMMFVAKVILADSLYIYLYMMMMMMMKLMVYKLSIDHGEGTQTLLLFICLFLKEGIDDFEFRLLSS